MASDKPHTGPQNFHEGATEGRAVPSGNRANSGSAQATSTINGATREGAEEKMNPPSTAAETPPLWAATANVKKICLAGPNGGVETSGTKHFRGGAKVYVIDAFYGTCDRITVIGQHRKSRRFLCVVMQARHIENFRPRAVYSPTVIRLAEKHFGPSRPLPTKEDAEKLCAVVQSWFKPSVGSVVEVPQSRPVIFGHIIAYLIAFLQRRTTN